MKRLAALVLVLAACSESKEAPTPAPEPASAPTPTPTPTPTPEEEKKPEPIDTKGAAMGGAVGDHVVVATKEFDDLPTEVPDDGKFVHGIKFADKNGENWVVFSEKIVRKKAKDEFDDATESRYIFARHVAVTPDGEYKELRLVRDKVEDCPFDLTARFDVKSISVTDLDDDKLGEITFGYELACRSDMSPGTYKLLVIEAGDKYIIRGTTKIMDPGGAYGGEMKIDQSFKKGPPEFLAHAKKLWPKLVVRR